MKNKYACPALLTLLLSSTSLSHAEVGLGILLEPWATTIYLPITLSEHLKLEPSVSYHAGKTDGNGSWSAWGVAVGAFRTTSIIENTRIYYGGRAGYFERSDQIDIFDEHGVMLAPTFGFEYFFTQSLSIAGEAAIAYRNVNGRVLDDEITSTDSSVILRYMF